ncbi:hypothetical protein SAMN02745216_05151 [Desulfatibacillum alkenivorans DSM 16219]|uniref:DUF554 domain-containing protein n=1 Tax=Desulfatibacillum alkenivorans DSM 16219 TaxID=1121393 RepID=A0A1M7AEP4_9BACT|nr:hypothetical protein SAMN02745216_05151 [Desulfatibacillum alkenivorans DSM 16219]
MPRPGFSFFEANVLGTIVNTGAILAGSFAGIAAGKRLPSRIKEILMQGMGLCIIYLGMSMALEGENALLTVGAVLLGAVTGELMQIERLLEKLAEKLKNMMGSASPTFVEGFVTASVIYLVGAMMILGCIDDGVKNDPTLLFIKSILDGVGSLALASSLGIGVAFSALSVFVVQGALTLTASHMVFLTEPAVLASLTSVGGILVMGIGVTILDVKRIRTANLLPAIVYAVIGGMLWG